MMSKNVLAVGVYISGTNTFFLICRLFESLKIKDLSGRVVLKMTPQKKQGSY